MKAFKSISLSYKPLPHSQPAVLLPGAEECSPHSSCGCTPEPTYFQSQPFCLKPQNSPPSHSFQSPSSHSLLIWGGGGSSNINRARTGHQWVKLRGKTPGRCLDGHLPSHGVGECRSRPARASDFSRGVTVSGYVIEKNNLTLYLICFFNFCILLWVKNIACSLKYTG